MAGVSRTRSRRWCHGRPPVQLDVDRLAMRTAAAPSHSPWAERGMFERVYVDWLLDYFEDRHEPAEVNAAVERFVELVRARLGRR